MKKVTQIFIVIELVCLLGLFLYTQKEEKPEVAEQIEETTTLEESQSDDIVAVLEESCTEEESETEEESTVSHEESEQEDFYAIVTEKSQTEVEEYARQVKELFLNHKWDKIAEMISYPIEINGIVYTTPSEIEHMQLEQNYSEMFISALGQESCQAMYCDSDGICLGSGEVWIAEVEQNGSKELKIVSINRLLKREGETNLLVREKRQEADPTAARETKYIYDNQEQLWKTIEYNSEGIVEEVCERNYDEAGNLLMKATYNSDGNIMQSYEWSYDKNKNLLEEILFDNKGTVTKTYDSKGKLLKTVTVDSAGNSVELEENSYDEAGNMVKVISYDNEGEITGNSEYEYDEAGNMLKRISYNREGRITRKGEFSYDDEGKLVGIINYVEYLDMYGIFPWPSEGLWNGNSEIYYDENDRVIKEIFHMLSTVYENPTGVKEYKYDEAGNLIEETVKVAGESQKMECVYNEQNQMVKYTYYYDGEIRESKECFYIIG